MQSGGLGRAKYRACRWAFGLCSLATLILIAVDPADDGIINRIVIGVLLIIGTLTVHFLDRRDIRDLAIIEATVVKERSRQSNSSSGRRLSQLLLTTLGRNNSVISTYSVAVEPPLEIGMGSLDSSQHGSIHPSLLVPSTVPPTQLQATTQHDGSTTDDVPPITDTQTTLSENETSAARLLSRRKSYHCVSDARRGRLINEMYMSEAVAIIGQIICWFCLIFIVELCVVAYFVTNYGSPPIICPTFPAIQLNIWQVIVDSLF